MALGRCRDHGPAARSWSVRGLGHGQLRELGSADEHVERDAARDALDPDRVRRVRLVEAKRGDRAISEADPPSPARYSELGQF
jgi:hypothetical protein